MTQAEQTQNVKHRVVYYIPGYDPMPPRRYRELYRSEGAAQAGISDYDLELSKLDSEGPFGWVATAGINGTQTRAEINVLVWSDIVRASMQNGIFATYMQMLRTAWAYIGSGALWRLMRLRKGPVIAALYPVGLLILQLLLALGVGGLVGRGVLAAAGAEMLALRWVIGVPVAYAVLRWFQKNDGRLFVYYLMHDYAHSAGWNGAYDPKLEERLKSFADIIARALETDADEVLIVGHSSGAHLAISILADMIRAGRVPPHGPALSLLTLGQVVPMVSFLPEAFRLRQDLAVLSEQRAITWVDVTAPGDGCAFALCDPVCVTGVAPAQKRWPLVISAAFTQTLSPERWKELRWRFFRLHFQYLCAFDRPSDYDYFQITAGPLSLKDRFEGRAPSPARIEATVNKYQGLEP